MPIQDGSKSHYINIDFFLDQELLNVSLCLPWKRPVCVAKCYSFEIINIMHTHDSLKKHYGEAESSFCCCSIIIEVNKHSDGVSMGILEPP